MKVEWPIDPSHTLQPMPPPEFEVYSLSSDSWRKVEFGISWRPNIWYYSINNNSPFPFVIGHLHFMVGTIRETGQQEMHPREMILSFDVNSEKIGELPVPDDDSFQGDISYGKRLTLFKGKFDAHQGVGHADHTSGNGAEFAQDPLSISSGPITRLRAKRFKEALNGLVQEKWADSKKSKMGSNNNQGLVHVIKAIEEANA